MATYMLRRYHARRAEVIETLGGKCVRCGTTEDLEIDHIDPSTKSYCVSHNWNLTPAKMAVELAKCQLLCEFHHIEKTREDFGYADARKTHGTISSYRYCKCAECKAAKSRYSKAYYLKKRAA